MNTKTSCYLKLKGIIDQITDNYFEVESFQEKINKDLLQSHLLIQYSFHLLSLIFELNYQSFTIVHLDLNNIFICKNSKNYDVFILRENIQATYQPLQQILQFKKIIRYLGFSFQILNKIINFDTAFQEFSKLLNQNQIQKSKQLLEKVYQYEVSQFNDYLPNRSEISKIKTPYFIKTNDQYVAVKWIREDDSNLLRHEAQLLQDMSGKGTYNLTNLHCYCLNSPNEILLFEVYYQWNFKEFVEQVLVQQQLTLQEKYRLCHQLTLTLQQLHENQKIVHRDLKPDNIMVKNQNLKGEFQFNDLKFIIIDFDRSLSKTAQDTNNEQYTGTQAFRPPELVTNNKFDESYDIWQLGMVFLYLERKQIIDSYPSKNRPYNKDHYEKEITMRIKEIENQCPQLYEIISQMLKYNPSDRPTLNEILKKLA